MTDKLLIEALEEVVRYIKGTSFGMAQRQVGKYEALIAAHRSQQEAAQEPVDRFCLACAMRDAAIGQKPSMEVPPAYLEWLATKSRSAGVGGNEAWNAGVEWQKSQAPAPSESEAQTDAVIYAALAAMDASFEADNEAKDICVPSHLAAALCLRLDEYRAALSASGQKGEPT